MTSDRRPLPPREEILAFIRENPAAAGKREIARAFNLKGAERIELKRLLREMTAAGEIEKPARKRFSRTGEGHLPPVTVLRVGPADPDGELTAAPQQWEGEGAPPPIVLAPRKKGEPAVGPGDRILARLHPVDAPGAHPGDPAGPCYEARIIRRLAAGPRRVLGVYRTDDLGGRVIPVDKRAAGELQVGRGEQGGARDGELVEVEVLGSPRTELRKARVIERLGDPSAPRAISLIAVHEHGIPVDFPPEALREAEAAAPLASLDGREDLRSLPLATIDPADARDHDDAVCAHADDDPENPGGWVVWVAIADVALHVRPGGALDEDARRRGNSCYFPDRVIPMLPDKLSGDLCSLHEGEDRPCLAVRMTLDAQGRKKNHRFTRAMMRSPASLTYQQAQAAQDGAPDAQTAPLLDSYIKPLFSAYRAAAAAREARSPLALDLPERKIILSPEGQVTSVAYRERLEAHRLIEEFMILANVCAAETLETRRRALLYRVHEEPSPEKIDALRAVLSGVGLTLAKGQVMTPRLLNRSLTAAAETEFVEMVNISVLRAQTQAYYSPENFGHFGLALSHYAHFTSPIRRYADLLVHRALIAAERFGPDPRKDGQTIEEAALLDETAEHISMTERRAMAAERDTNDRYLAAFMADRVGAEFEGRIAGVARFGLFVKLDETGADGLVPIGTLGREYFHYDEAAQALIGERTRTVLNLGQRARVRLREASPVTGGLIFELVEAEGAGRMTPAPKGRRGRGGRGFGQTPGAPTSKKRGKFKTARTRAAKKAERSRGESR